MNKPAFLKLSTAMILFGSIGFFSRLTGLPSLELVFVRCVSATVILSIYWLAAGQYKTEKWNRKEFVFIIIGGIFLVLNWVFLFLSFETTSITAAISIYNLAPLLVLVIGWIFLKEPFQLTGFLAVVLAFVGTVLITVTSQTSLGDVLLKGSVYALIASVFYALTIITGKKISQASPYLVTFTQTAVGVIMLLPFVAFSKYSGLTVSNWMFSLITGVIHTGVVYLLFYGSIRYLSTTVISAVVYLDPLVAILLDIFVTGFSPSYLQILGIIFIFTAVTYTLKKST
ncbi:DMT family transporter [Sporolactobacillus sp. THM7-4]|nr:DMT family transporter [Sporolactobacillus sp. THM7-4]